MFGSVYSNNCSESFFSILTFQRCLELSLLGPGLKNSLARFPVFDDPPVPAGSGESGNGA